MFVLHIDMKPKPSSEQALEGIYLDHFRPTVSRQPGFVDVHLLRPEKGGSDYRLCLSFDNQASQQQWVETDVHQKLWPQLEGQCVGYSVKYYKPVE